MRSSNLFAGSKNANANQQQTPVSIAGPNLPFDPYSISPLPRRLIATGAAANFPSVVNLLGDVFNAPIFIPQTQLDSAHAVAPSGPGNISGPPAQFAAAHRNAPAPGFASRAALGSAYVARWAWSRDRAGNAPSANPVTFEDEVRRLLARRYNATVGLRAKQNAGSGGVAAGGSAGSGTHSPSPDLKSQRSGIGADVLIEEEEEEEDGYNGIRTGGSLSAGTGMSSATTPPPRVRTATGSSLATSASLGVSPIVSTSGSTFTALTSPDASSYMGGNINNNPVLNVPGTSSAGAATPTETGTGSGANASGITPLTPVGALSTADAEAQLGWTKVADPDLDAFLAYASVVPEFSRLEGMLIKALV